MVLKIAAFQVVHSHLLPATILDTVQIAVVLIRSLAAVGLGHGVRSEIMPGNGYR